MQTAIVANLVNNPEEVYRRLCFHNLVKIDLYSEIVEFGDHGNASLILSPTGPGFLNY